MRMVYNMQAGDVMQDSVFLSVFFSVLIVPGSYHFFNLLNGCLKRPQLLLDIFNPDYKNIYFSALLRDMFHG